MTAPADGRTPGVTKTQGVERETKVSDPKVIVVVNRRAGEVLQAGEERFRSEIMAGFSRAGLSADVRLVNPRQLNEAIGEAARATPAALIVAGGDGTLNRLLPHLVDVDLPIGVIPLGTWNLLARDLGLAGTPQEVIERLARLEVGRVDLAAVNGNLFHTNAGLGFLAMMAREREQARRRFPWSKAFSFAVAAFRTFIFHRPVTVLVELDGKPVEFQAAGVLVTNNRFSGTPWHRERLDEGLLEIHMLQAGGMFARLRALRAALNGTWRDLPDLKSIVAQKLTLRRRGRFRSTIALDGEVYRVSNPVAFESRPTALTLIGAARGRDDPNRSDASNAGPGTSP